MLSGERGGGGWGSWCWLRGGDCYAMLGWGGIDCYSLPGNCPNCLINAGHLKYWIWYDILNIRNYPC